MQIIDIHHHLIHGVDDGPRTFEDTQAMLLKASENGIGTIYATSHSTPGVEPFPSETYLQHLEMAQQWCDQRGLGIQIRAGSEIFYTDAAVRLVQEGYIPSLDYSKVVLLEFGLETPYPKFKEAVERFGVAGYSVIVAHIERYRAMHNIKQLAELHDEYGAVMQMNARTVISKNGFFEDRWVRKVIENGYVDMIGSDAHNVESRVCCMGKCFAYLAERYGEEYACELCGDNQRKLLGE